MRRTNLLDEVRRKRGYLLSYHRLLHAIQPELLAAYDAFYTRFTLDDDVLSPVEKETVWLALIVATRARVGTIHLKRAVAAGMSRDAIADALALAAACESLDAIGFARDAFPDWVDESRLVKRYVRAFEAARGRTKPVLAEIAAAVAHAGRRNAEGQRLHLERAFERGAKPATVAKALSFVLLHCGGPTMLAAMEVWLKMVKQGKFPSPFGAKSK
ncbi:MAG: carboxymuconolactone decarboxylase family protein [Betaproteobacteria bacterium]|nr:carboxymuconolactone decarboxylase family protein [Betaproteobacteria bacterium]